MKQENLVVPGAVAPKAGKEALGKRKEEKPVRPAKERASEKPEKPAQEPPKSKDRYAELRTGRKEAPKPRREPVQPAGKHMKFDGDKPHAVAAGGLALLVQPTSEWTSIALPALDVPADKVPKTVTDDAVAALHALGQQVLDDENATYARLSMGEGGKNVTLGSMSLSDLQFARTLLTSHKASTLSDRISAVTLLLQSSPIHNVKSLETLVAMAAKPSREEAGRATRALADWLASGGGLGAGKLHYFRDQPLLPTAAAALAKGTSQALRVCCCLWAFEDMLKKTYFAFVQTLERQSHDTLLFMRKQAVSQVFVLLRDKAEQEHNLLRLLTNKLGDPDRSVASKASTHLMELLHAHPAMKSIVLREVSETVLRSQVVLHSPTAEDAGKGNTHATYYGVLTLNQTLFTSHDAALANEVFSVYFQLFDVCLERGEKEEKEGKGEEKPRDKKRWRDHAATKRDLVNKQASDVDSRLLAAILTGIRRVFPFTDLDTTALDKHLDTLFRITHTHSFNIAIQALQLIFQVAIGSAKDANGPQFSSQVGDRYYRTLYDSLLDNRLATTSKQAMYLNLLYKSIKADLDPERTKAFIKRLCQVLCHQEPPFICGALVLLYELFHAQPGLRAMITEPEDDGVEYFVDQDKAVDGVPAAPETRRLYDGRKRDPRFAHAGDTVLWDILPLRHHFHPSVSLNAQQLLDGDKVTSNADLTLNTLMHFLDRFVFRNPKKQTGIKGSSIMQPALSGSADTEVLVRRGQAPLTYVNSAAFWNQRAEDVPVDQQFFLQFFQARNKRQGQAQDAKPQHPAEHDQDAPAPSDDDLSTEDEGEKEIWKAMKNSIPQESGDELDEDDDDGVMDALDDSDDSDGGHIQDDNDDDEPGMFVEDEDDLVPFAEFSEDEDEDEPTAGTKRPADDTEADDAPKTKSGARADARRKRRALPAFASAEDYAHMLLSDDEGN